MGHFATDNNLTPAKHYFCGFFASEVLKSVNFLKKVKIICKKFGKYKIPPYLCTIKQTQSINKQNLQLWHFTFQKQIQPLLTLAALTPATLSYHAVTTPAKKLSRFWLPCHLIATFVSFNTTQTKRQRKDLNNHLAFNTFLVQVTPKVTVTCTFPFLLWINIFLTILIFLS